MGKIIYPNTQKRQDAKQLIKNNLDYICSRIDEDLPIDKQEALLHCIGITINLCKQYGFAYEINHATREYILREL